MVTNNHDTNEKKYQTILQTALDGFWLVDMQGRFLEVNDAYCALTGYTRTELLAMSIPDVEAVEEPEETAQHMEKVMGEGSDRFETKHRCKDGKLIDVEVSVTYFESENQLIVFVRDITERKRKEELLREKEGQLRGILESQQDLIVRVDLKGRLTYVNDAYCRVFGKSRAELIGYTFAPLVHPDDLQETMEAMEYLYVPPYRAYMEQRAMTVDGWRWLAWEDYAIRDVEDNVLEIQGVGRDITERKEAEEKLKISEKRFKDLALSSADWWWEMDREGRYTFCSERVTSVLGYTPAEIIGKTPFDFMIETDASRMKEFFQSLVLQPKPMIDVENRNIGKNGEEVVLLTSGVPVFDEAGNLTGYRGVDKDITERKQAENEVKKLSERLALANDAAGIGIWDYDLSTNELIWDHTMYHLYGISPSDFSGVYEAWSKGVHTDDFPRVNGEVELALKGEKPFDTEFRVVWPDGSVRHLKASAAVHRNEDGTPLRMIGVNWDITEKKRAEEKINKYTSELELKNVELENARDLALQASRAKSEFLATMSHEIRTPMNSIIGMSELLAETSLSPEQEEYVRIFRGAGEALLTLINDILDISKIEAGHFELDENVFDLVDVAEKTVEMMAARGHAKGLELACRILPDTPSFIKGDGGRLRQILVNLLGNAVKFTEQGEIVLTVEPLEGVSEAGQKDGKDEKDEEEGVWLIFSVSDTGIGIPDDKMEAIFEGFTQVDSSSTRKYGGTGLGLTISRRLVELMGGILWVESMPGLGSTFFFTAYFKTVHPSQMVTEAQLPSLHLEGVHVLVVDDNATNRLILKETLAAKGALVTEAQSGEAALDTLRDADASGKPYMLLLLDCMMPKMDGLELAERVKGKKPDLPIIMLSSEMQNQDRIRSRALNLDAFLLKPVRRQELLNVIARALEKSEKVPPQLEKTEAVGQNSEGTINMETKPLNDKMPAADSKDGAESLSDVTKGEMNILLVEDNADNRLLIKAFLKKTGYHLSMAENGKEAVLKFKDNTYDLVFMDIQMPVMDGYMATRQIRHWETEQKLTPTPIVALTAYALKEEMQKALDAGCDAHLAKPVKKRILLDTIAQYTKK